MRQTLRMISKVTAVRDLAGTSVVDIAKTGRSMNPYFRGVVVRPAVKSIRRSPPPLPNHRRQEKVPYPIFEPHASPARETPKRRATLDNSQEVSQAHRQEAASSYFTGLFFYNFFYFIFYLFIF